MLILWAVIAIIIGVGLLLINGLFPWGLFALLARLSFALAIVFVVIQVIAFFVHYNAFGGGAYYFMMDGTMYTIPTGLTSYFDYGRGDLLQLDTMPTDIEPDYINSITVTVDGTDKVIDDADGIAALFDLFGDITLTSCADYYTDETERAETYGLDGSDRILISYKRAVTSTDADGNQTTNRLNTSYTFLFGEAADGGYYGSPEKSTIAYLIGAETVDAVAEYLTYEPAPVSEEP